ncbi:MAG: hypothetical protein QM740_20500 [Acidovorax sp.]
MSRLQTALCLVAVLALYGIAGYLDEHSVPGIHAHPDTPQTQGWEAARRRRTAAGPSAFPTPGRLQAPEQEVSP